MTKLIPAENLLGIKVIIEGVRKLCVFPWKLNRVYNRDGRRAYVVSIKFIKKLFVRKCVDY